MVLYLHVSIQISASKKMDGIPTQVPSPDGARIPEQVLAGINSARRANHLCIV